MPRRTRSSFCAYTTRFHRQPAHSNACKPRRTRSSVCTNTTHPHQQRAHSNACKPRSHEGHEARSVRIQLAFTSNQLTSTPLKHEDTKDRSSFWTNTTRFHRKPAHSNACKPPSHEARSVQASLRDLRAFVVNRRCGLATSPLEADILSTTNFVCFVPS